MRIKRMLTVVVVLLLCLALCAPAFAANQVTEIAVDVTLQPDGTAYVVQTWSGKFNEGTECYFPVTNLGDIELSGLTVSDRDGPYTMAESWDTGASFEDKVRKCGLNPVEGGYEVCWGITEYGENLYSVEYELSGLVAAYEDADGFLFQFVPSGMSTGPTDVTVRILTQNNTSLTEENAGIWAFGFEGQIEFQEGGVLAYTESPVTEEGSIIVMLQLDKGVLTPSRTVPSSFEEVKAQAFEGSDYFDEEGFGWIGWIKVFLCGVAVFVLFIWVCGKEGRRIKQLYKTTDYWREAPIGGNLEASFVLAERFSQTKDEGNLIAATLTQLLEEGCLTPESESDIGLMGREKKRLSLRLVKPPTQGLTATALYHLLSLASGDDGVLQEHELECYCETNYTALFDVVQEAKRDGGETLAGIGCYKAPLRTNKLSGLTDRGQTLLLQLMGYKKYLLEFSLIAERGAKEALIWQDCLTYAALLGIGEQVLKELRKLYPSVDAKFQRAESIYYTAYRYHMITYGAAKSAQTEAQRISGDGGSASFGGGGGYSGGGSGGGTR